MKTTIVNIALVAASLIITPLSVTASNPLPESIVVITSDKKTMTDVNNVKSLMQRHAKTFESHNLDDVSRLEKRWSEGLPAKESNARIAFEKRFAAKGRQDFEAELRTVYAGLFLALRHDIDRYPAIIFDNQYVVYGVLDMSKAMRLYDEYLSKQGRAHE